MLFMQFREALYSNFAVLTIYTVNKNIQIDGTHALVEG